MTATPEPTHAGSPAIQRFLQMLEQEHATTMKVLRAYPADQADLRPAEKSKTARELACVFAVESRMGVDAATTGFDFEKMSPPEIPADFSEIVDQVEAAHQKLVETVRAQSEEHLHGTIQFFVGPKTLGDVVRMDFLWMLLHDQIHHRGQFSVYLRMAGGKVPSIYGPTADEPWI